MQRSGMGMGMGSRAVAVVALAVAAGALPTTAAAQELADFDYENLAFRGFGVDWGYIFPSQVEPTQAFGIRVDLGYLGPGLRIMPYASYWSSRLQDEEVAALEGSLERLIQRESGSTASVNLGTIDRSDLALGLDGHVVWSVPYGLLTYAGAGAAAHFLNGGGEAIDDTFVEDLLDTVTAGFNLHVGVEYPRERLRVYGGARYELLDDLQYFGLELGLQIMTGSSAPGERTLRSGG